MEPTGHYDGFPRAWELHTAGSIIALGPVRVQGHLDPLGIGTSRRSWRPE